MSSAAEILVIILSITLSIFLIVAIVLGIYLIRLSAEIRRITKSAQNTVDTIGEAVEGVVKITSPVFIARALGQLFTKFNKKSGKGK